MKKLFIYYKKIGVNGKESMLYWRTKTYLNTCGLDDIKQEINYVFAEQRYLANYIIDFI